VGNLLFVFVIEDGVFFFFLHVIQQAYETKCWCGNSIPAASDAIDEIYCQNECSEDGLLICGEVSIYYTSYRIISNECEHVHDCVAPVII
jgi:hypothetical protein